MPDPLYLKNCQKLLSDFENTQEQLLRLDLKSAGEDFLIELNQMREFFKQVSKDLENFSFNSSKDQILISKQIERLLVFLKEMDMHIKGFFTEKRQNENEVIFIFERQHLFKNIYRKHLKDFASIIT
jgi:hypothetical protein